MKPTIKSVCESCAKKCECRDKRWYEKRGSKCLYCGKQK